MANIFKILYLILWYEIVTFCKACSHKFLCYSAEIPTFHSINIKDLNKFLFVTISHHPYSEMFQERELQTTKILIYVMLGQVRVKECPACLELHVKNIKSTRFEISLF